MNVGLRIDVDTWRGTRFGTPTLCDILARHGIRGTFYFSVGPDNMGRHLWRLLRPAFLWKMLRTRAGSLYGWDIILRGTFWPGPEIGRGLAPQIRAVADAGHEVGLHAWDHHKWQAAIDTMTAAQLHQEIKKGYNRLSDILGHPPATSAAPGWRCNEQTLLEKAEFNFTYNSDCRGRHIFMPVVNGVRLNQPQVPVTMPTYDETVGQNGFTNDNYNDYMLKQLRPEGLNVLTIHAEAEGNVCREMFEDYLKRAKAMGARFMPLEDLLKMLPEPPEDRIIMREIPGREGWVAWQDPVFSAA
ncbi:MAG: 4-deoxy-4-formamido-L-arabinose-phosphoundecaprenol deformylase [Spartobacteria bacterium]|nr:4-deoxy-4-formamido-L-arabinose-phosphoundecaprenol deformylase [Spartobacteria bacterium]